MKTKAFVLGKLYTRPQITEILGGGEHRPYLISQNGEITAGCFDPSMNRRAPIEVDVGSKPKVVRRALMLGKAKSTIPIFLKRNTHEWEYSGMHRCLRFSQDLRDIRAYPDRRTD